MSRQRVDVVVELVDGRLRVRWREGDRTGSFHFDHVAPSQPEWLGAADDLLDGLDRRRTDGVLGAIAEWSRANHQTVGIWHDDGGIELLE